MKDHGNDSRYMALHLDKIINYVLQPNAQYSLSEGISAFIEDPEASKLVDTYFLETKDSKSFDAEDFKQTFIKAFTGEVRPPEVVALHELMSGLVTQGSDPVAKYAERFYQRSRCSGPVSLVSCTSSS